MKLGGVKVALLVNFNVTRVEEGIKDRAKKDFPICRVLSPSPRPSPGRGEGDYCSGDPKRFVLFDAFIAAARCERAGQSDSPRSGLGEQEPRQKRPTAAQVFSAAPLRKELRPPFSFRPPR
jgi:hypothetical protein